MRLALDFDGSCIIDTSLMVEPPKVRESEASADRQAMTEALMRKVHQMKADGLTQRQIARDLSMSLGKVNKLLRAA
jgi:DNA-binding CsgD family transcriptional regulator